MREFNLPLAVEVLANIEFSREDKTATALGWDQGYWARVDAEALLENEDLVHDNAGNLVGIGTCGTAMCAAGWALSVARVPMVWTPSGVGRFTADYTADGTGVKEKAAELLGIPEDEAYDGYYDEDGDFRSGLFDGDNNLDDLYERIAHYADHSVDVVRNLVVQNMDAARNFKAEREAHLVRVNQT